MLNPLFSPSHPVHTPERKSDVGLSRRNQMWPVRIPSKQGGPFNFIPSAEPVLARTAPRQHQHQHHPHSIRDGGRLYLVDFKSGSDPRNSTESDLFLDIPRRSVLFFWILFSPRNLVGLGNLELCFSSSSLFISGVFFSRQQTESRLF
jgi:hypothetical protein